MTTDRRTFLQLLGTGALAATIPASIARALEIPANHRTGTINDVEHIVILTQENRSFDHYFGTLKGVRGFGDPRTISLPNGKSVWYQPASTDATSSSYVLPFHPTAPDLGMQFLQDISHGWESGHQAWDHGKNDQWIPAKGVAGMAYYTRNDIPYHYALADAFTICDAYHCSFMGATDPNRYHLWTGWVGNDGKKGGPVLDNSEAGYDWSTFPEVMQKAGVSWKVYQDIGAGLTAAEYWGWGSNPYIGNYGDNSLLYFHQYQNAQPGNPLADNAKTGTDVKTSGTLFDIFRADVLADTLPQVSYIAAPEAYSEHPNWPPNYGAWYISQMLDALTANPEVWSKTVFFLMYDENGGFFDHVVPPTPPESRSQGLSTVDTKYEIFPGNATYSSGPVGLGVRVPMVVISPWSKGGYVNSQAFDHTSLIQFIQARFGPTHGGLPEPNITEWRNAVAGDLTSAFNFSNPDEAVVSLPSTAAYEPHDKLKHPDYTPIPPTDQTLPVQEPGQRPARALPYEFNVHGQADAANGAFNLLFHNSGDAAVVFQVRSGSSDTVLKSGQHAGPWTYTLRKQTEITDTWDVTASSLRAYDLSVFGPNGSLREFRGSLLASGKAHLDIKSSYDVAHNAIKLEISNRGEAIDALSVRNAYSNETRTHSLRAGENMTEYWVLNSSYGWYDLAITVASDAGFKQRLAGHLENGKDSMSDPAIGAPAAI